MRLPSQGGFQTETLPSGSTPARDAMPLTIYLQDESGAQLTWVEDPTDVLSRVLPEPGNRSYACLNNIDPYGDTIFNYLQAPRLAAEWNSLSDPPDDPDRARVLASVAKLIHELADRAHGPGVYLRFCGD